MIRRRAIEPVRYLLSPNAFKGSLTAIQAARALAAGIRRARPDARCLLLPVADGGDGTLEVLVAGSNGRLLSARTLDPLGRPIRTRCGVSADGRVGFVEMARASGLALLDAGERDPMRTDTRGTGRLIHFLLDRGVREIVVAAGGSATVDGGTGAARALGYRFLDRQGKELSAGGGDLIRLAAIDASRRDPRLDRVRVRIACDVRNPLLGPLGAARVFGPQKGARPAQVRRLEAGLGRLAAIARRALGIEIAQVARGGAAGGLAAGLHAFAGARLEDGATLVLEALDFRRRLRPGDVVVVGEGCLDRSSWMGKVPVVAARLARRFGADVVAVCGSADPEAAARFARTLGPVYTAAARPRAPAGNPGTAARILAGTAERMASGLPECVCGSRSAESLR